MQVIAYWNAPQIYTGPMAMIVSVLLGPRLSVGQLFFGTPLELGTADTC